MNEVTLYDYARKKVVYCWLDECVNDAAQRLAEENIGSMIADDRKGKHVGMLTDIILFKAISIGSELYDLKVKDLELEPFVTLKMDASVDEAMGLFNRTSASRIALVDGDGDIIGIIKRKNLERFATLRMGEAACKRGRAKK
jgi:predicted transcriptional regulator